MASSNYIGRAEILHEWQWQPPGGAGCAGGGGFGGRGGGCGGCAGCAGCAVTQPRPKVASVPLTIKENSPNSS